MKTMMEETELVMPEYIRNRLLCLAGRYRALSEMYENIHTDSVREKKDNRLSIWIDEQAKQNSKIFAKQFADISDVMEQSAEGMFHLIFPKTRRGKMLIAELKRQGIVVKEARFLQLKDDKFGISITMRQLTREKVSTRDMAGLLSLFFGRRVQECKSASRYIGDVFDTYIFLEEPRFHIITGVARAMKESENVSGDNFSIWEGDYGNMVCMLSDGCGSGEKAAKESEVVIDFMERLLSAEFDKELAARMLDNALSGLPEGENMSSLDICEIDLYEGEAQFMKYGAVNSFVKRQEHVEIFHNDTLPLGLNNRNIPILQSYTLQDGDTVIMISDGVLDCYEQERSFLTIEEQLEEMTMLNPRDMANTLLQSAIAFAGGKIQDDMTVMVAQIWENPM